jgi:hypothetical protein
LRARPCPALPMVTQRWPLIVQQEKLLRLAVSDYIDGIADRRGLRQRVITQPKTRRGPEAIFSCVRSFSTQILLQKSKIEQP